MIVCRFCIMHGSPSPAAWLYQTPLTRQLPNYNLRVQGVRDAVRDIIKQLVREECGPGFLRIAVGATPLPGVLRARIGLQPVFK